MSSSGIRLEKPPVARCQCGHQAGQHDPIALRYCAATDALGLTRGCICSAVVSLASIRS